MESDNRAGYHWFLIDDGNRSVMRRIAFDMLLPEEAGGLYTYVHTYQAFKPGTSYIYMIYNRSLALDPVPAAVFNISVTVR